MLWNFFLNHILYVQNKPPFFFFHCMDSCLQYFGGLPVRRSYILLVNIQPVVSAYIARKNWPVISLMEPHLIVQSFIVMQNYEKWKQN